MISLTILLAATVQPMAVVVNTDPITDKPAAFAALQNGQDVIAVGCHKTTGSEMRIIFRSDRYLQSTSWLNPTRPFTYRFDKDEPTTSEWFYDRDMVEQFNGPELRRFVSRLATASQLVVRARNYDGDRIDAVFDIVGAEPALRRVFQLCGATKLEARVFGGGNPAK